MLTRCRKAQACASPDTVLPLLPRCFVRAVFTLLPVDTRLRCSEVSRAWRALLDDTTLWACISLCTSSGMARFSLPLLRAAVAKAGGQLRALDIRRPTFNFSLHEVLLLNRLLLEIVVANAATLTELLMDTESYTRSTEDL